MKRCSTPSPYPWFLSPTDAAFLLTMEFFLLTVENFSFLLTVLAFLLTAVAFLHTIGAFLLTVGKCVFWRPQGTVSKET